MSEKQRKPFRSRLAAYLKGETTPGVDPDVVREMAKLLEETGLSEIEVERGGVRVRVADSGGGAAPTARLRRNRSEPWRTPAHPRRAGHW